MRCSLSVPVQLRRDGDAKVPKHEPEDHSILFDLFCCSSTRTPEDSPENFNVRTARRNARMSRNSPKRCRDVPVGFVGGDHVSHLTQVDSVRVPCALRAASPFRPSLNAIHGLSMASVDTDGQTEELFSDCSRETRDPSDRSGERSEESGGETSWRGTASDVSGDRSEGESSAKDPTPAGGSRISSSTQSEPEQSSPSRSSVASWNRDDFGFAVADEGRADEVPTSWDETTLLQATLELGGTDEGFQTFKNFQVQFQRMNVEGTGKLSQRELLDHALRGVNGREIDHNLQLVIEEMVRRRFGEMSLRFHVDGIGEEEWIHHMMLRNSSPSYLATKMLNEQLQAMPAHQPSFLEQIQIAFCAFDTRGEGYVPRKHWRRAVQVARGVYATDDVNVEDFDTNGDGTMNYFEFVACVVGCRPVEVDLAMYDLSGGAASWIPSAVLDGHKFAGVWHTGVRVFGKEYWYGGYIYEQADFSRVPFGAPTRVLRLGKTLVSEGKFQEFLGSEMTGIFRPQNYDVLQNNCNFFSNEVVQFLLNGKQIPEEVLVQPSLVHRSTLAPLVVPLMNGRLGGDVANRMSHRIDDLTHEWRRRVRVGDVVLCRQRFVDSPFVALITGLEVIHCQRFADIIVFRGEKEDDPDGPQDDNTWNMEPHTLAGVPDTQLFPCLEETQAGATILRVWRTVNRRAGTVMRRPSAILPLPCCQEGHGLELSPPGWFGGKPLCSVCGQRFDAGRMSCTLCNFELCGMCVARGTSVGAFSDVLTPSQAEELLDHEEWLKFVSRVYFNRADICSRGWLDEHELKSFCGRISAELGVSGVTNQDLFAFARLAREEADDPQKYLRPGFGPEAFEILFKILVQRVHRSDDSPVRVPFAVCVERSSRNGPSFEL